MQLHVLMVNINNLKLTKDAVDDLIRQNREFKLTVMDQASTEAGTTEYFNSLKRYKNINVVLNSSQLDLNRIWNTFATTNEEPYLCFLNNDVRIPKNFVADTIDILNKEPLVGCVLHSTNHPSYKIATKLNYKILTEPSTQGWDFTFRRECYRPIPDNLRTFGGDDFLFVHLNRKGWKTAVAISSPMIHYKSKSHQFFNGNRREEIINYNKFFYEKIRYGNEYTNLYPHPDFTEIKEII